jgi:regulation of enolase protein 1 (concanavalin A-like superfamily)
VTSIEWSSGAWLNEPPTHRVDESQLIVETGFESDFWRETGYGFVHDSGHALLRDFPASTAMEVEFSADWAHEFDQAGLLLHADEMHWVKAGVEFADGVLGLGAVVTDGKSDWSVGHVPEWMEQRIRVRVSRTSDAITIRACTPGEAWRLVRLAPIDPALSWSAGPLAASPTRAGLQVTFHAWEISAADTDIH